MPIVGNTSSQRKSVPNPPTVSSASQTAAGESSVNVSLSAPSFNGKLPITSYSVISIPGSITGTSSSTTVQVNGLTLGTNYTFTATAANAIGTSTSSAAGGSVTPTDAFFHARYTFNSASSSTASYENIGIDSSRSIYINANQQTDNNLNYGILFKVNSSGILQWQKLYGNNTGTSGSALAVKQDGTCYAMSQVYDFSYPNRPTVFITDSSGNLTYQRNQINGFLGAIAINSSGNAVTGGNSQAYTAGGYAVWNSDLSSSSIGRYGSQISTGMNIDASDNIYLCGANSDNLSLGKLVKINSSGTKVFDKTFAVSGNAVQMKKAIADSSGNVYALGYYYNGSPSSFFVVKLNSSGTFQWARAFNRGYANGYGDIALDSSGNIYVAGYGNVSTGDSVYYGMIIKLDSSGTTQWQRLYDPGAYSFIKAILVDSSNTMYISSTINSSNQNVVLTKLPSDGSKTGSYSGTGVNLSYTASSYSISNLSMTVSDTTTTINNLPTITGSNQGYTYSNTTVNRNQVAIP